MIEETFWSRVDCRGFADCWLWQRGTDGRGYGQFWVPVGWLELPPGCSRKVKAHRVAYRLLHGFWPELDALHGCDTPLCCNALNPRHVHAGTDLQNAQEREARGRGAPQHGVHNWAAKFTDAQVREIRRIYRAGGVRQADLAAEFGVSQGSVSEIVSGKRYA